MNSTGTTSTRTHALDLIERLRADGEDFCVVTIVRTADATSAKAGAKGVVTADGELHGYIGGSCVSRAATAAAVQAMAQDEPRLIRVRPAEDVVTALDVDGAELHKSSCPSGGTVDLFVEPVRQRARLIVCGTSPVAVTLERLARAMGYDAVLAARPGDRHQAPDAQAYHDGFDLTQLALRESDAVIVATQGQRDREALVGALASACGYVGMVGSRRKIGRLLEQLESAVPAQRLSDLRGPAGLDIGAIEPEEIALSILGEIVDVRRKQTRRGQPHLQTSHSQTEEKLLGSQRPASDRSAERPGLRGTQRP